MTKQYVSIMIGLAALAGAAGSSAAGETRAQAGALGFREVWQRVREHNPRIAAAAHGAAAARGRLDQAGAFPNPEISVEAEDFGGAAGNAPWDAPEITYRLSQRFEVGGSRGKRMAAWRAEEGATSALHRSSVLDAWRDAVVAFAAVLAARDGLDLAERHAELFDEMLRTIRARAEAGKVAPLEVSRAAAELSLGAAGIARARGRLEAARLRLAALWGAGEFDAGDVEGRLDATAIIPPDSVLRAGLAAAPELARAGSEVERMKALAGFEKALRIPDVTVSGGVRQFAAESDPTYVAEISLPIPLFDRNTGAVRAAERERDAAERELRALETSFRAGVESLRGECAALEIEIATLRDVAVPAAREAFRAVDAGYRQGKYGYLDLLDAERSLVGVEARYIEVLAEHASAAAEIGRMTGTIELFEFFGSQRSGEEH